MKIDDLEQVQKLAGLWRDRVHARTELAIPIGKLSILTVGGRYPLDFYADDHPETEMTLQEEVQIKIQLELVSQLDREIESLEEQLIGLGVKVDP